MALEYGWATADDLEAVEHFLRRHYGEGAVQSVPGRFRWLCAGHPAGLHVTLCRDAGRIVATCCHQAVPLFCAGRPVEAGYGFDFLVAADHRRRGIGRRFLDLRLERFAVSLSSGQSSEMAGLYRSRGALLLASFQRALFVRRLTGGGGLKNLLRGACAGALRLARRRVAGDREEIGLAAAGALLTELEPVPAKNETGRIPRADYLDWRYGGPVYRDHRYWLLETAGGSRGLLVTRLEPGREVLVDLCCAPDQRRDLLRLAGDTSSAPELAALTAGRPLADALRAAGWLVRPADQRLVALTADPALTDELARCAWTSFAGDSDADLLRQP